MNHDTLDSRWRQHSTMAVGGKLSNGAAAESRRRNVLRQRRTISSGVQSLVKSGRLRKIT
jgi:hypothetical protein